MSFNTVVLGSRAGLHENTKMRGNDLDMHLLRATLCYNRSLCGWAVPGESGPDARVVDRATATQLIHKMARLMA